MFKYPVIVFEGIETSGKSTNLRKLSSYLKKINRKFIKIREPGGTKSSENIRRLILNKNSNLNFKTDLLLIIASRSENIEKILKKNLGKKIIIIDRFIDSTIAYQHYGMGINLKLIKSLNNFVLGKFKPNFTILNIVNKKNLNIRLKKRNSLNKYDKFNYLFYQKVQKGFLKLAKKKNYLVLDSNNKNIEENFQILKERIKKLI
tara:strand:+ start:156 stop:767 length:612 start_codon:yes stop_codon:yes gene_type:complete